MNRRLCAALLVLALWAGAWPVFAAEHPLAAPVARSLAAMRAKGTNFSAAPALDALSRPDFIERGGPAYELMAKNLEAKFSLTTQAYAELEKDPAKLERAFIEAAQAASREVSAETAGMIEAGKTDQAEDYFLAHLALLGETDRAGLGGKIAARRRESLEAALGPIAAAVERLGAEPIDFNGAHDSREAPPMGENERIGQEQSRRNLSRWNPERARASNAELEEIVTEHFHELIQAAREGRQDRFVSLSRGFFESLGHGAGNIPLYGAPAAWEAAKFDSYRRQVDKLDAKIRDVQQRYDFARGGAELRKFRADALAGIAAAQAHVRRREEAAFRKVLGSAKALDRLAARREIGKPEVLDHFADVLDFLDKKRRQAWTHADPGGLGSVPRAVSRFQRDIQDGAEALETAWTRQVLGKGKMVKILRLKSYGWFILAPAAWLPAACGALFAPDRDFGVLASVGLCFGLVAVGAFGFSRSLMRGLDLRGQIDRSRKIETEIEALMSARVPDSW